MQTFNKIYVNVKDLDNYVALHELDKYPNILLQIFTGICDYQYILTLIKLIKKRIPDIKIIGSTTSGEIIDNRAIQDQTILSFSIFEQTHIEIYQVEYDTDSQTTAENLTALFRKDMKPQVAISFADGLHMNGEEYLTALKKYDDDLVIAGGMAGDNSTFEGTIVFTHNKILIKGAVVALLYNKNLFTHTKAIYGWKNIGKSLTITKADKNIVYEIDNISAFDIYAKYLGDDIAVELPETGIEFPLIIEKDGQSIARAVLGKNDDGSLIFAGNLHVGDKVTFGYGNVEAIIRNSNSIQKEILGNPIESIFVYSCMARKALMGESVGVELEPLADIATVSGFFTYGEFFSNTKIGSSELLNQTMTILGLSENDTTTKESISNKSYVAKESSKTLKALSHLISQTTYELEEINASLTLKVEEEVKKNREKDQQIIQQGRLAQMGEMISMIAHQWRQPLASISSTTALLTIKAQLNTLDNKLTLKLADDISNYSQHLSETINDFRSFFKPNKETQNTSFCQLVNEVLKIVGVSVQNHNIEIITDLECLDTFKTYPNEVKQVILNLIKNAEDILIEKGVENPYIKITATRNGSHHMLSVEDNGGGIPMVIMDKIFDPYFSTKKSKDGTGLGLYMSKTIIEEHCEGSLEVANTKEGVVFSITI